MAMFRVYGTYGTEAKAAKALRRRCPGFSVRQYANALRKADALHETVIAEVAARSRSLLQQTDFAAKRFPDLSDLRQRVRDECPGFWWGTYQGAIWWIFYIYYLR